MKKLVIPAPEKCQRDFELLRQESTNLSQCLLHIFSRNGTKAWSAQLRLPNRSKNMSFALYVVGFIVFIAGLIWGAVQLGISHTWIAIGALVLLGIAIFTGAVKTRRRDPSES
jgi:hypothetical protein